MIYLYYLYIYICIYIYEDKDSGLSIHYCDPALMSINKMTFNTLSLIHT